MPKLTKSGENFTKNRRGRKGNRYFVRMRFLSIQKYKENESEVEKEKVDRK